MTDFYANFCDFFFVVNVNCLFSLDQLILIVLKGSKKSNFIRREKLKISVSSWTCFFVELFTQIAVE